MNLQDYYMTADLHEPPQFHQREFAIVKDTPTKQNPKPPMWRHLQFDTPQKLRSFLIQHIPSHVYFSVAKYENPSERDMTIKKEGWLGSDLIFDIDDDHLDNPTLAEAAFHLLQLKDILDKKFALKDIMFTFSGSRGYHAHVRDDSIQPLNNYARQQIVEYIKQFNIGIDAPVTCDTARLIRLPGSIHGKTGKACRIINPI